MGEKAIPVVLSGLGWWAKNRTIIPLIDQFPEIIQIVAVTSLIGGMDEFNKSVKPVFESRGLPIPDYIDNFERSINKYAEISDQKAIIINTPNSFHFQEAKKALESDFHVYVERPIACPSDNLTELINISETNKKLLFTGVQRRLEDTYCYLQQVVKKHIEFKEISTIRCHLLVGEKCQGWRCKSALSGGGIVLDSGYHLLDAVAWILNSAGLKTLKILSGTVHLQTDDEVAFPEYRPLDVETTAAGHLVLSQGILIFFDFSYHTPVKRIYERVEIHDNKRARITLSRDHGVRSPLPALITHQRSDGSFVEIPSLVNQNIKLKFDNISFSGKANCAGPIKAFFDKIKSGNFDQSHMHPCHASESINTWKLVREIYRLAGNN